MLIDINDQRKQNISLERSTPIRQTAVSLPITFLKEMQMLTAGDRIPTFAPLLDVAVALAASGLEMLACTRKTIDSHSVRT